MQFKGSFCVIATRLESPVVLKLMASGPVVTPDFVSYNRFTASWMQLITRLCYITCILSRLPDYL